MSGKPKPTEAENLRQLTREAHEAIKDLKAAIREIRAERAEHAAFLKDFMRLASAAAAEDITDAGAIAMDHLQAQVDRAMGHMAELLGVADTSELSNVIVDRAARELAAQLTLAIDEDGQPVIRPRARAGEVFVTTDPALAPPGSVILDAR